MRGSLCHLMIYRNSMPPAAHRLLVQVFANSFVSFHPVWGTCRFVAVPAERLCLLAFPPRNGCWSSTGSGCAQQRPPAKSLRFATQHRANERTGSHRYPGHAPGFSEGYAAQVSRERFRAACWPGTPRDHDNLDTGESLPQLRLAAGTPSNLSRRQA